MKPAPFNLLRPKSVDEALALLRSHGDEAKVLAGGQSLVPLMNFRLAQPHNLIDLNGIEGLDQIKLDDQTLSLGAMVRQRDVERSPAIAERLPILREAIEQVAHPAIRNRGTVGGSLVHADPSAELPLLAIALDSTFHLRSARASRSVAAKDFYQGYLLTDIAPDELLVAIDFHLPPVDSGWCCTEIARRHGDFAIVAVAVVLELWARSAQSISRASHLAESVRRRCARRQRNRRSWASGLAPKFFAARAMLRCKRWIRRPTSTLLPSYRRHLDRRVGAPRLGNRGKSDQRAGVMTDMISITFKVNGSEQSAALVRLVSLSLMIFFCLAAPLSAASLQKIVVAYVSPSDSMIIPGIARDSGILAKYGFDADVVLVTGSPRVVQSLIGGSFDYAIPGGTPLLRARVQGADTVILSTITDYSTQRVMVHPRSGIQSVEQLKGKKVGVTQYGSEGDAFLRLVLQRAGLKPDIDVQIIQTGGSGLTVTSSSSGQNRRGRHGRKRDIRVGLPQDRGEDSNHRSGAQSPGPFRRSGHDAPKDCPEPG